MTTYNPNIPIIESTNSTINGFLPPVVSTQAANGILRREPDKDGAATRSASRIGLTPEKLFLKSAAVEP